MTHTRIIAVVAGIFVAALPTVAAETNAVSKDPSQLQRYEFLQIRMAVPVRITVYARDEPSANQATQAAYRRIKQIDRLLSHYDPDSELSRLCRGAIPGVPVPVSDEMFDVLSHAEHISRQSKGAFDVTVGPLMNLWRKSRRMKELPSERELADALQRVGYQHVRLDPKTKTVTLSRTGMLLDLGGIAKGYAADEALRVLKEHGVERVLIDAGGDIVVGEPPPDTDGWRVGIAPLDSPDDRPQRFLTLAHAAVATSGDASQYVEIDGIRYSHLLDPRTGLGLTTHSSVTVVAPTGIVADSLASAVSVLGPEEGLQFINTHDRIETLILLRDQHGLKSFESLGLKDLEAGPLRSSAR